MARSTFASSRKTHSIALGLFAAAATGLGLQSNAAPTSFGDIDPDIIFGTGNANGEFSIDTEVAATNEPVVQLGLRAKVRYDLATDSPQNVFNRQDPVDPSLYVMPVGAPAAFPDRARWNFEWTINADLNDVVGDSVLFRPAAELRYELRFDVDPSAAENFFIYDPINFLLPPIFGDNDDINSVGGTPATGTPGNFLTTSSLAGNNNVAQNSTNPAFLNLFFSFASIPAFDPNVVGTYEIELEAFDGATSVAETSITVSVVPEPVTLGLAGLGLFGLLGFRNRYSAEDAD